MKKLIKLFMSALIFVAVASCDDTNKVDYVPPVKITFAGVDDSNIAVVAKGETSYTANITIASTTSKIRSMAVYAADSITGAKGRKLKNDTLFNPTLSTYSFDFVINGLTQNKAIMIEVEDDNLAKYNKKLLVKIARDMFETGIVTVESSEAFYGPYFGSWLGGRSYISIEARKHVSEIDFSFGNIAITGTDTVAAFVSPDKREELGLPFIPNMRSCKFELTALTKANFDAVTATDGSAIRALAEPTQSVLKAEALKIYSYENDTEKGLIYVGVLQIKKGTLQQQDGTWAQNRTFHQLKIITKTVMKE
jgi:hypothetical protein